MHKLGSVALIFEGILKARIGHVDGYDVTTAGISQLLEPGPLCRILDLGMNKLVEHVDLMDDVEDKTLDLREGEFIGAVAAARESFEHGLVLRELPRKGALLDRFDNLLVEG